MSSRLFEEIREQRGLAYVVGSGATSYVDAGALTIYAGTGPSQVAEVLRLIDVELAKLLADGISADEAGDRQRVPDRGLRDGAGGHREPDGPARRGLTTTDAIRPVEDQVARWRR